MRAGGGFPEVKAKDYWLEELRLGHAFMGRVSQAAVAAQYAHVQLLNPAGSGVIVLVRWVGMRIATAGAASLHRYDTALTNANGVSGNLLAGGAAAVAQLRDVANAAQLGTRIGVVSMPAEETVPMGLPWFMELGEGEGLVVSNNVVNDGVTANFMWVELP